MWLVGPDPGLGDESGRLTKGVLGEAQGWRLWSLGWGPGDLGDPVLCKGLAPPQSQL